MQDVIEIPRIWADLLDEWNITQDDFIGYLENNGKSLTTLETDLRLGHLSSTKLYNDLHYYIQNYGSTWDEFRVFTAFIELYDQLVMLIDKQYYIVNIEFMSYPGQVMVKLRLSDIDALESCCKIVMNLDEDSNIINLGLESGKRVKKYIDAYNDQYILVFAKLLQTLGKHYNRFPISSILFWSFSPKEFNYELNTLGEYSVTIGHDTRSAEYLSLVTRGSSNVEERSDEV